MRGGKPALQLLAIFESLSGQILNEIMFSNFGSFHIHDSGLDNPIAQGIQKLIAFSLIPPIDGSRSDSFRTQIHGEKRTRTQQN